MGNFNHCCCRTVSLLQIKITGNENLLHRFHKVIITVTIVRFPREEKYPELRMERAHIPQRLR